MERENSLPCGAKRAMLTLVVVFKGIAYYKDWYTEVTEEKHAYFAYSPQRWVQYLIVCIYPANGPTGYTADEIGLDWL